MAIILNIDTATEIATVGISEGTTVLASETSETPMKHASFVQPAIEKLLGDLSLSLSVMDAIAITAGPGSYTGLRVGMASAKGICYALNKPLILLNTLEVMATASIRQSNAENVLHCPMIDARRMEVFTGLYRNNLTSVIPPAAMVLSDDSFMEYLVKNKIIFSGSGSPKLAAILTSEHALFSTVERDTVDLAILANTYYLQNRFADLAYSEPFYLKEFYNPRA